MTRLYTMNNKLIFDEPTLNLREAVEEHKNKLGYADLERAILIQTNLKGVDLMKANLRGAILKGANLD